MKQAATRLALLILAIFLLSLPACTGTVEGQSEGQKVAPAADAGAVTVPGVDLSGLTPEQRQQAVQIFHDNGCNCGCNMTVYQCRNDDPNCGRSPVLAADVVRLLADGKTPEQVVQAVFRPAAAAGRPAGAPAAVPAGGAKELVFDVQAGNAASVGPADATVTLISFLDYQ